MIRAKWLTFLCVFIVTVSMINLSFVEANSTNQIDSKIKELEEEQKKLNSKKSKVTEDKREVEQKMNENKSSQKTVEQQMTEIESELNKTESEIKETTEAIAKTETEIDELEQNIRKLNEEIKELKERISLREELLKERLRSIQESGGNVKYITVLFGSQSFTDLITRSSAVNAIMDQDKNIMEEHAADQLALEEKQVEVKEKKKEVELQKEKQEEQKENLEGLKNKLDDQKAEKEKIKAQLEDEFEELEEYNLSLEEEQQIIADQAVALEKAKKLAEQEKKKLAEQKQSNSQGNGSGGNKVSGGSGMFIWPTTGRVTSEFGPRWGKLHKGIDIGGTNGATVVASAPAVVSRTVTNCVAGDTEEHKKCGSRYANHVYVTHYIQGKAHTTVYAHLPSLNVSVNQSVSQGQALGKVGNTGHSYGAHLHFEIHPGGFSGEASAVNPRNFLP